VGHQQGKLVLYGVDGLLFLLWVFELLLLEERRYLLGLSMKVAREVIHILKQ
jgi:hypothetical protein